LQAARPGALVSVEERLLALHEFRPPWIVGRQPGDGALDADELAAGVAALVEPVGKNEARPVIVGTIAHA
jgi:hypothetical protein